MPDPAEDVPTDGPGGQSDRRLHLGALGLGVPWAIRIGAVIELADEFDWAFKGVEMAIAMIADMHHAPARGAIPVQHVKFPESEVSVGWPAVGHCIDLRIVPVGLHVLLSAGRKDTKQPCSVLAPFLAVVVKRQVRLIEVGSHRGDEVGEDAMINLPGIAAHGIALPLVPEHALDLAPGKLDLPEE